MRTISHPAVCWNSPAPASLFSWDTDERSARATRFSRERKEPSRGERLQRFSAAPDGAGERPTPSPEELGKRHGPGAPERGLPVTRSLQAHRTLPWPRDLDRRVPHGRMG